MNYYQKWGRFPYRILYITTLVFCVLFFKQNVEAATSNYSVYPVQDKDGCSATKVCTYKTFYVNFWNSGDANQQFKSTTATIKKNGNVVKSVTRTANNYMNWSNADFYLTEAGKYTLERSAVTTKGSTLNWDATDMYVYQPSALGSINASSSSISLSITGTNSKTITFSQSGICPDQVYLSFSVSNSNVSCSWGNWNDAGTSCPLTITGKYGGTDNVTVSMYESSTKTLVSTITVSVTIGPNYTVSYNANGGSGAPSSQTKYYGKTLTLSITRPSRTGYEFLGWSTSSSATSATYSAGGSYTSNANATLYAVWKRITYTIS
ncbi:MAG: InlB B-repeat-containing protein, partial [Eubacterium sp.]|nr:InlB B-repeat-containing protein [Eubacterium sp.]